MLITGGTYSTKSFGVGHIYVTNHQVRKEVPLKEENEWWSPIQKLVLSVDMDRHQQKNIQLPDRFDTLLLRTRPVSSTSFGIRNSPARIWRPSYVCQGCVSVLSVDIGMFGWKVGFGISLEYLIKYWKKYVSVFLAIVYRIWLGCVIALKVTF